eukprot:TRINITY_DN26020_c0_g1_i1.p1 TRINITY_DN26020_c0_g1~~TRINITY_DN26020_c0_g1_i1.p1  ORF type:complete len:289 (-),score=18.55 TRINITY_DN26020_c0_g1_i1:61-927(-)
MDECDASKRRRIGEAPRARSQSHEDQKEAMHMRVADSVENDCRIVRPDDRYVKFTDRERDSDMSLATLEALYYGQARCTWRGIALGKCALDFQIYTAMIDEIKPRTIIDLGSWAGGSALFFADFGHLLVGEAFSKVISVDITLNNVRPAALKDKRIEFYECDTATLEKVFTEDFCASLPHPWLISEDAHYNFDAVMSCFHSAMKPGDYFVCEDTSTLLHGWFEENNQDANDEGHAATEEAIRQLRHKVKVLEDYCTRFADQYRCDTKYLDMFGYNVGKHWNSILKRIC